MFDNKTKNKRKKAINTQISTEHKRIKNMQKKDKYLLSVKCSSKKRIGTKC